jgi:hypothetical protein
MITIPTLQKILKEILSTDDEGRLSQEMQEGKTHLTKYILKQQRWKK